MTGQGDGLGRLESQKAGASVNQDEGSGHLPAREEALSNGGEIC